MTYFWHRPCNRGATLVEVLISSALLMIVMTLVAHLVQVSSRQYMLMEASLDLQRESVRAANWITREMAEGNRLSVEHFPPGAGQLESLTFGSARNQDGSLQYTIGGKLVWQQKVCFFIERLDGRSTLQRIATPLAIRTAFPPRIQPVGYPVPDRAETFLKQDLSKRVIARDVDRIILDGSVSPVKLTLELSSQKFGKPFTATIESKIHFRN